MMETSTRSESFFVSTGAASDTRIHSTLEMFW